jgi:hypothetical protein
MDPGCPLRLAGTKGPHRISDYMPYKVIFDNGLLSRAESYAASLATGVAIPGVYLAEHVKRDGVPIAPLELLERLVQTKRPQIFAESAVAGDGSDWNAKELSLLGDISIAAEVEVFDDGRHFDPMPHMPPFAGTLVFTCGALLANGRGNLTPDFQEIAQDGRINQAVCNALYLRRLRPVFGFIQATAAARARNAVVTVPGLGCGQFAGNFLGQMGSVLQLALEHVLDTMSHRLTNVSVVVFDPYNECEDHTAIFGTTEFRVRPLLRSKSPNPQLCKPQSYAERGEDFSHCDLYSLVAWDQVSWPGNDFYAGARATDDGVKAAATSSMLAMTGIAGRYDTQRAQYQPPSQYRSWGDCVHRNRLTLSVRDPFIFG